MKDFPSLLRSLSKSILPEAIKDLNKDSIDEDFFSDILTPTTYMNPTLCVFT